MNEHIGHDLDDRDARNVILAVPDVKLSIAILLTNHQVFTTSSTDSSSVKFILEENYFAKCFEATKCICILFNCKKNPLVGKKKSNSFKHSQICQAPTTSA